MSYDQAPQEPAYKPVCCSQRSKWICLSPSLHYFYCEVCKREVSAGGGNPEPEKDLHDTINANGMNALGGGFSSYNGGANSGVWSTPPAQLDSYGNPIFPFPVGSGGGTTTFKKGDIIARKDGTGVDYIVDYYAPILHEYTCSSHVTGNLIFLPGDRTDLWAVKVSAGNLPPAYHATKGRLAPKNIPFTPWSVGDTIENTRSLNCLIIEGGDSSGVHGRLFNPKLTGYTPYTIDRDDYPDWQLVPKGAKPLSKPAPPRFKTGDVVMRIDGSMEDLKIKRFSPIFDEYYGETHFGDIRVIKGAESDRWILR